MTTRILNGALLILLILQSVEVGLEIGKGKPWWPPALWVLFTLVIYLIPGDKARKPKSVDEEAEDDGASWLQ